MKERDEKRDDGTLTKLFVASKHLQVIDLKDNLIATIPPEVFDSFRNARVLDLRKNALDTLPEEISRCAALEDLYLDENRLKALPELVGTLKLRTLCCAQNKLQSLPQSISKLTTLRCLQVGDNLLGFVPDLSELKELSQLFIHHNHFTRLPTGLHALKKLTEFALEWFRYTSPALPRVLRGAEAVPLITKLRDLDKKSGGKGLSFLDIFQ